MAATDPDLQGEMVAFRGIFVGIDRYRDSAVLWLAGAGRDARAAHVLFTDTLGEGPSLLVDEHATTGAIRKALEAIQGEATADDIVVFFYAGHSSEDHHLVTYDTDPAGCARDPRRRRAQLAVHRRLFRRS